MMKQIQSESSDPASQVSYYPVRCNVNVGWNANQIDLLRSQLSSDPFHVLTLVEMPLFNVRFF